MSSIDLTTSAKPHLEAAAYVPLVLPAHTRVAFVEASWHADIVQSAREAFLAEMHRHDVPDTAIDVVRVPGAFEIPLHARRLARTGRYAAIVGCALVVDGGVYRHDFVAATVVQALMQVQLETDVPMISAVQAPHHFHEHAEHRRYLTEHFAIKGTEAAQACAQTILGLAQLSRVASGG